MATPTADEVIRRVRALLQDETTPFRYSDSQMIDSLNDGLNRLVDLRPDEFIGVSFDPARVAALVDTLDVPWKFIHPLTVFVAGYMMLREDEFATDGRAVALIGAAGVIATVAPADVG